MADLSNFQRFWELIDELRRLQKITPIPPNNHQRRALDQAAARVDVMVEQLRSQMEAAWVPGPAAPSGS